MLGVMLLSSSRLLRPGAAACFKSSRHHGSLLLSNLARVSAPELAPSSAAGLGSGQGSKLPDLAMTDGPQLPALTLEKTLEVVKIPPNNTNPGARVEHIEVTADGQLSDVVATALQLPRWFVLELIRFGAIHYSPIMPSPAVTARPRMSQQHIQHVEQLRAAGIAKLGRNPKLQHPKRVLQDSTVTAGGYVRVHVHPKRFPAAHSVDWRQLILADRAEYVVVDKPAGVQVPPTVDNLLESVVCCTAMALGLPHDALLNTHRLDAGTSGVVVLAKNSSFAAWFNALLKNKPDNVVKMYRCLTATPPPLGSMVHYATMRARAAGEPAHTRMRRAAAAAGAAAPRGSPDTTATAAAGAATMETGGEHQEEGARCELIVLKVEPVALTGKAAADWGSSAYETTLQLVTGRTHQIRAQMAAEGCPLLGDQLYQALAVMWQQEQQQQHIAAEHQDHIQIQQVQGNLRIQQQQQQQQQSKVESGNGEGQQQTAHQHAGAAWSRIYQEDPLRPIGLQAYMLRVRDVDGRMTGEGVKEQQQQQFKTGDQRSQQAEEQPSPGTNNYGKHAGSDSQRIHDTGSESSSGAGTAGESVDRWVEFRTGIPWWRL